MQKNSGYKDTLVNGWPEQLCYFSIFAFLFTTNVRAQQKIPSTTWILPGITYKYSDIFKTTAQYGISTHQYVDVVYVQSYIKVSKHLILNPAYLYLNYHPSLGRNYPEQTLMNGCILTTRWKTILLEDRNIFWHRFRQHAEDIHIYRNRFRLNWSLPGKLHQTKLYIFNEMWLLLNEPGWMRNRLAIGITSDLIRWFNVDIAYASEQDKVNGKLHLFFILGTLQIGRRNK